ncbi:MAG: HDOD domain-containing protein [Pseudomonadota bacterium]
MQPAEPLIPLSERLTRDLAAGALDVPVLPQVAGDVLSLCVDQDGSVGALAQLIERDQALAGNLLRIANSPAYRGAVEVVALHQALTRLGLAAIRDITLSITMQGLSAPLVDLHALAQRFWQRSLGTALWAREVARHRRRNVEDAYLCGLLHNVGATVVLRWLAEQPDPVAEEDAERLALEHAHVAGICLADAWDLPPVVVLAICHAHPDAVPEALAEDPRAEGLQGIIELSHAFLASASQPEESRVEWLSAQAPAQRLNLYPDDLGMLLLNAEMIATQLQFMAD